MRQEACRLASKVTIICLVVIIIMRMRMLFPHKWRSNCDIFWRDHREDTAAVVLEAPFLARLSLEVGHPPLPPPVEKQN